MNIIKKVKSWFCRSDKEEDAVYEDWKKSYYELKQLIEKEKAEFIELKRSVLSHNFLESASSVDPKSIQRLDFCLANGVRYDLVKVYAPYNGWNGSVHFLIQIRYYGEEFYYTIRDFADPGTEYAERCAREAFEYLTKEI